MNQGLHGVQTAEPKAFWIAGADRRASRDPARMMSPHRRQRGVVTVVDVVHRRDGYRAWASSAFPALLNFL